MIQFRTVAQLKQHIRSLLQQGKTIGFVPTMGALHQGHLTLIDKSKEQTDITVCSIFVNPAQFNDPTDFEKYPVTIEKDILALISSGADILFLPTVDEIYPSGYADDKNYDLGSLESVLEGAYRPGHFQGVCRVVERLLEIVTPTTLFLGQKDLQQCMVLKRLVELMDIATQIVICPTEREPSGLAMSSRNMRLSAAEREQAIAIFEGLQYIKTNISVIPFSILIETVSKNLTDAGFHAIDYVNIVNATTLEAADEYDGKTTLAALIAAFIGPVRLIDNLLIPAAT
jgi:pantoate--beta-alanine ligase